MFFFIFFIFFILLERTLGFYFCGVDTREIKRLACYVLLQFLGYSRLLCLLPSAKWIISEIIPCRWERCYQQKKKKRKQGNHTPHVIHNLFPFPRNIGVYSNSSCRSVNSGSNTIAVCQEVWSLIKKREKKKGGEKRRKKKKKVFIYVYWNVEVQREALKIKKKRRKLFQSCIFVTKGQCPPHSTRIALLCELGNNSSINKQRGNS